MIASCEGRRAVFGRALTDEAGMHFLRHAFVVLALLLAIMPAEAHYNMLLPKTASAKRGEAVEVMYQWGHPFEHQLFDAPAPQKVWAITPAGKQIDLTDKLEKIAVEGDQKKKVAAYRLLFTPDERGDYVLVLLTPPI